MSVEWRREGFNSGANGGLSQTDIAATNGTFEATKIFVRNTHATATLYVGVNDTSFNSARALYVLAAAAAGIEVSLAPGDTLNLLGSAPITFSYNRMRLK